MKKIISSSLALLLSTNIYSMMRVIVNFKKFDRNLTKELFCLKAKSSLSTMKDYQNAEKTCTKCNSDDTSENLYQLKHHNIKKDSKNFLLQTQKGKFEEIYEKIKKIYLIAENNFDEDRQGWWNTIEESFIMEHFKFIYLELNKRYVNKEYDFEYLKTIYNALEELFNKIKVLKDRTKYFDELYIALPKILEDLENF